MTIWFDIYLSIFPSVFCPCLHVICFTTETSHWLAWLLALTLVSVSAEVTSRLQRTSGARALATCHQSLAITCWLSSRVTCLLVTAKHVWSRVLSPRVSEGHWRLWHLRCRVARASLSPASWPGGGQCRAHQPIRGRDQGRVTNQRPSWADRSRDHQWHTAMASEQPQLPQRRILRASITSSFLFRTVH